MSAPHTCNPPVPVASPDALLRRYAAALGHAPPAPNDLRALAYGLLTEQAEVIALHLEDAAFTCADDPAVRADAPVLSHAAMIVRRAFGVVRPVR